MDAVNERVCSWQQEMPQLIIELPPEWSHCIGCSDWAVTVAALA
jgi:hypothetical protein